MFNLKLFLSEVIHTPAMEGIYLEGIPHPPGISTEKYSDYGKYQVYYCRPLPNPLPTPLTFPALSMVKVWIFSGKYYAQINVSCTIIIMI